jgi:hypothetical protein
MRGNGIVAIRVHSIADLNQATTSAGASPATQGIQKSGWVNATDVPTMPLSDVAFDLGGRTNHTFGTLFPIYDWATNNGFANLGTWIDAAARQAGHEALAIAAHCSLLATNNIGRRGVVGSAKPGLDAVPIVMSG